MTLSAPVTTITDSTPVAFVHRITSMDGESDSGPGSSKSLVYKGKATHRSWPQLPEELIRLIATFYLHNLASTSYCPQTWESHEFWHQRMVYTALRDGLDLERNVMAVCLGWHRALQNHLLWQQSIALIDPMDYFAAHMYVAQPKPLPPPSHSSARLGGSAQSQRQPPPPLKLSPWRHLRNVLTYSCAVCRINQPPTNVGLGNVHHGTTSRRTMMHTPYFGMISVCREHEKRKAAFCGLCLRESPTFETSNLGFGLGMGPGMNGQSHKHTLGQLVSSIGCFDNEDDDTWPNVDATCKSCRMEWLWRKAYMQPIDREAIGGPDEVTSPTFLPVPTLQVLLQNSQDWETRHTLEGFVDMAEGTISDVLTLAREKWWLRKFTRLGDMMMQAVAARKWVNGGGESSTTLLRGERKEHRQQQHRDVHVVVDESEVDDGRERERAQLALDLELAVQLEREEREKEDGEYDQPKQRRARTPSPPVRPQEYEAPVTIQFAADAYPELERFEDRDEVLSQAISQEDLSEEEEDDEDDEEEEEDASVLQTEENGVRELALGDWARAKILDGYWVSPADVWYGLDKVYKGSGMGVGQKYPDGGAGGDDDGAGGTKSAGVDKDRRKEGWTLAVHPCPWTIEGGPEGGETGQQRRRPRQGADASGEEQNQDQSVEEGERVEVGQEQEQEESHPRWETVVSNGPLTYALCEQAYNAHQKQMRLIVMPAMRNVVRKLVIECGAAALPEDEESDGGVWRGRTGSVSSSSSGSTSCKRKGSTSGVKGSGLRDPAIIASRMTIEEVVKIMREEEGVWFEGVDWVEKRRNEKEAENVAAAAKRKRNISRTVVRLAGVDENNDASGGEGESVAAIAGGSPPKKKRRKTKDGEDELAFCGASDTPIPSSTSVSTSSTASESVEEDIISSGSGTSPVLSTTTLQTTPSPPPSTSTAEDGSETVDTRDDKMPDAHDEEEEQGTRIRIPVSPILERPRLLRPIPYVPLTLEGMAHYTLQVLKSAWRDACSPLYHCRCQICERAALAAAAASGNGRRNSTSGAGSTEYSEPRQQDQRKTYQQPQERHQTVPPQSPRKDERERPRQEKEHRMPAVRLRPVASLEPDLLPREEEEEEEESLLEEEEEDFESGEEFERLVDEQDLYLDDDEYDDDQYEQVRYPYVDEQARSDGGGDGLDDVVEIDVGDVELGSDVGMEPVEPKLSPATTNLPLGTPITPSRSARKRSCDEEELELDHSGRTISTSAPSTEEMATAVVDNPKKNASRPPTPPKRQKTASSVELGKLRG